LGEICLKRIARFSQEESCELKIDGSLPRLEY
jgi:hypothetical protein